MADLELVTGLSKDFHAYSMWRKEPFDEYAVKSLLYNLIQSGGVFTNGSGFIAGMLVPAFFSPTLVTATELAWWAPRGGGRELRDSFERWSLDNGASMVQFAALADDNWEEVNNNLLLNGYKLAELSFVKRLK